MYSTKNVLFLALAFMAIGLVVLFFTHQEPLIPNDGSDVRGLVSAEEYIGYIEPWIKNASLDQSLNNISDIKAKFLDLKSSDKSIGSAHLTLFLAFDAWEKFLLTGDEANRQIAINHFFRASDLLPDLAPDIQNLADLLKDKNV